VTSSLHITRFLILPGPEVVSVGMAVNDGPLCWGACTPLGDDDPSPADAVRTLRRIVRPALQNALPPNFLDLSARLGELTETVTRTHSLPPPVRAGGAVSRRDLLTGRPWLPRPFPTKTVTVQQPLHPAILFGVSVALLRAMAAARGLPPADFLAEACRLSPPDAPLPLHADIEESDPGAVDAFILRRVASVGYAVPAGNRKTAAGPNAERLQRNVRRLKERLLAILPSDRRPILHLNLRGVLGDLYGDNIGKILGALYGLRRAAEPYPLRVENPLCAERSDVLLERLAQLGELLRLRGVAVELAQGEGIHSAAAVDALRQTGAVTMARLSAPRLGGLHATLSLAQTCAEAGLSALLDGEFARFPDAADVLTDVALVLRPAFFAVPVIGGQGQVLSQIRTHIARTLAHYGAMEES